MVLETDTNVRMSSVCGKLSTDVAKVLLVWYASVCGFCCGIALVAVLLTYPVAWFFRATPDIADMAVLAVWLTPAVMIATAVSNYSGARRRVKLQRYVIVYPRRIWIQTLTSLCALLATIMALYVAIVYVRTFAINEIVNIPVELQTHIGILLVPSLILVVLGYYGRHSAGGKSIARSYL